MQEYNGVVALGYLYSRLVFSLEAVRYLPDLSLCSEGTAPGHIPGTYRR